MQKVLLILGMHRSGTSLVTQWLFRCGLDVGTRLLAASIGNADGHYEDEDFLSLHEEWLVKRGFINSGLIDQSPVPLQKDEVQQLSALISQKNDHNSQWGFKEPRTCLWLDGYRQCLPDAYSLIIIRNFNDTVNSLVMREYKICDKQHDKKVETKRGLSWIKWNYIKRKRATYYFKLLAEEYLRVWVNYYEKIIEHFNALSPEKYLLVSYENLLQNDTMVMKHLVDEWGFALQPVPFKNVFKKELLSKTRTISNYVSDKALVARAQELEAICLKLSQVALHFAS